MVLQGGGCWFWGSSKEGDDSDSLANSLGALSLHDREDDIGYHQQHSMSDDQVPSTGSFDSNKTSFGNGNGTEIKGQQHQTITPSTTCCDEDRAHLADALNKDDSNDDSQSVEEVETTLTTCAPLQSRGKILQAVLPPAASRVIKNDIYIFPHNFFHTQQLHLPNGDCLAAQKASFPTHIAPWHQDDRSAPMTGVADLRPFPEAPTTWWHWLVSLHFWALAAEVINVYTIVVLKMSLVLLTILSMWLFATTFRKDVSTKVSRHAAESSAKARECEAEYMRNKCDPTTRVPALESICNTWKVCMSEAPMESRGAMLSAQTLGEVVNAFFEQLAWRSFALFVGALLFLLVAINALAGWSQKRKTPPADFTGDGGHISSPMLLDRAALGCVNCMRRQNRGAANFS